MWLCTLCTHLLHCHWRYGWLVCKTEPKKHPEDSANVFTQPANPNSVGLQQIIRLVVVLHSDQCFRNAWLSKSDLAISTRTAKWQSAVHWCDLWLCCKKKKLYEKHTCSGGEKEIWNRMTACTCTRLSELSAFTADKRCNQKWPLACSSIKAAPSYAKILWRKLRFL